MNSEERKEILNNLLQAITSMMEVEPEEKKETSQLKKQSESLFELCELELNGINKQLMKDLSVEDALTLKRKKNKIENLRDACMQVVKL